MIAEHDAGRTAECADEAQRRGRFGTAIDQIACEPELILGRIEI